MSTVERLPGSRYATRFVVWSRAWRAGFVPFDDMAPNITGVEDHLVKGLLGGERQLSLPQALAAFSALGPDDIRLVLPAPGDPRGLPGPGSFTSAALAAGEGVIAGKTGLVPTIQSHVSGSGDSWRSVYWQAFDVTPFTGETIALSEAEADLSRELTRAAETLISLDIARWQPELAKALTRLRSPETSDTDLPAGFTPRARRVYARACLVNQVLALADHAAPGGAVNAFEARRRAEALSPLRAACRRAVMAVCHTPLG
ncbi:MAG: hypothetical protein H0T78_06680 [Longispora sp.]|nr:hypothetical protein [Longispora sp. (in: high G+C Gram-positive bacteria)]